jgi:hypothetical protein
LLRPCSQLSTVLGFVRITLAKTARDKCSFSRSSRSSFGSISGTSSGSSLIRFSVIFPSCSDCSALMPSISSLNILRFFMLAVPLACYIDAETVRNCRTCGNRLWSDTLCRFVTSTLWLRLRSASRISRPLSGVEGEQGRRGLITKIQFALPLNTPFLISQPFLWLFLDTVCFCE